MLSKDDEKQLSEVDAELASIIRDAEKIVPLTVIEGHRGEAAQNKAFAEKKSKLQWPNGKHNRLPSDAVDVAPTYYEKGTKIDWNDVIAFGRIMGVIQCLAFQRGVKLRFGLDWDGDFPECRSRSHRVLSRCSARGESKMNKAIVKFLLGRGVGKVQEIISKAVRHGLTTAGGALVTQGLITDSDMATLQGAAAILVGVVLSVARTFLEKYAKNL